MIMPACAGMLINFSQLIKSYKHVPQKIEPLKTSCYTIVEVFTFIIVNSIIIAFDNQFANNHLVGTSESYNGQVQN